MSERQTYHAIDLPSLFLHADAIVCQGHKRSKGQRLHLHPRPRPDVQARSHDNPAIEELNLGCLRAKKMVLSF
jgi:hypothetical protein